MQRYSVALGATVTEKHFTISRSDGGIDATFSMEPEEMKSLVEESIRSWQALGKVHYGQTGCEKESIKFRRSLYVVEDVKKGEIFTAKNLRIIHPGNGLPPHYYQMILGRKAASVVKRGTAMRWNLIA